VTGPRGARRGSDPPTRGRARAPVTRAGLQLASLALPASPPERLFDAAADIARRAESCGFDSFWLGDHFHDNPYTGAAKEPLPEPYTLLAAIAAQTDRIALGTLVSGVTHRNPALLAKTVTTLDVVSGGRAILGIGAAWHAGEHRAYGLDFPPLSERFDRLEEALQICRAMLTEEVAGFAGRHYRVDGALNYPRPIRSTGIPILVGGSGERRTLRLVARYGDACNISGDAKTIRHKVSVLRRWCEAEERDPADITVTRVGTLVIGATAAEARSRAAALRHERRLDEELFRAAVTAGNPREVAEQLEEHRAAGVDGAIFNVAGVGEPERLELAGEALSLAAASGRP
jgi:F420-dependent oxidoreductase-like protein